MMIKRAVQWNISTGPSGAEEGRDTVFYHRWTAER